MFARRKATAGEGSGSPRLTAVRDVVEIVAIVAAGAWGFYTFVYQNEIKPANSAPIVQFEATMTRLAERRGFIAVRSHLSIKNEGVTNVTLYGVAETVLGSRIRPRPVSQSPRLDPGASHVELEPGWIDDPSTPVYSFGLLTTLADRNSKTTIELEPGQSLPIDRLFYVAAGKYDELEMSIALRYAARAAFVPFHLSNDRRLVELVSPSKSDEIDGVDGTPATLSLW